MSDASIFKIENKIKSLKNKKKEKILQRFFKTGPGEYGEGDLFLGITVPKTRQLVKDIYKEYSWDELVQIIPHLIKSPFHEVRLFTLLLLVCHYEQKNSDSKCKKKVVEIYLNSMQYINNWDLIDLTAHKILGHYLYNFDLNTSQKKLAQLIARPHWNERRISIIASFYFIKKGEFELPLYLLKKIMDDPHELLNKAQGWMLREIGKIDESVLINFLDENATKMKRVALRYSIERLSEKNRKYYLSLPRNN